MCLFVYFFTAQTKYRFPKKYIICLVFSHNVQTKNKQLINSYTKKYIIYNKSQLQTKIIIIKYISYRKITRKITRKKQTIRSENLMPTGRFSEKTRPNTATLVRC